MVRSEAMGNDYFQIRKLLWDEIKLSVRASEEEELRGAVGSHLIEGNEDLRQELAVLAEILTEFQQQNDDIRVYRRLNLDEIDAIKEDLRDALHDERQLLLEDIDFIQGCLEMEKDLIDDDRRKVAAVKPPPTLSDLHDLRKMLEKTLEDQVKSTNLTLNAVVGTRG
uniref:Uncharacterized protein n=1 Tax=Phytophthora ramorum TaxID=164328 RepID=H3GH05_PHYRM